MLKPSGNMNTWIKYLDDQLEPAAKKLFENKLTKSPKMLNDLLEFKKDMSLMEAVPFQEVPIDLLNKVLKRKELAAEEGQEKWLEIVVTLLEKSFKIITNTSPSPPQRELLAYRNSAFSYEQLIFPTKDANITLLPLPHNKFNIELSVNTPESAFKNVILYIQVETERRMIASFRPSKGYVVFKDLLPAHYMISFGSYNLNLIVQTTA